MSKSNKETKSKKVSITEEYFSYHDKYIAKYGPNTLVLLEVGSFYEMYSNPNTKRGPDLYAVSNITNLSVTRKDKSIPLSDVNVLMAGMPNHAISKFLKILIDNNYTIVVFNQYKKSDKEIIRTFEGVYSPATFIDNTCVESKYMMTLYFEINNALHSSKPNISVGMSAIDTSTGQIHWYETHGSNICSETEVWDETQRFYHFYRPVELVVYQIDNVVNMSDNNLQKKINIGEKIDILPNQVMTTYSKINPEYTKLSYQNKLLGKVYSSGGLETPIEKCGLERAPYATISLINSLDFVYQHDPNLISNLAIPKYFDEYKYMILGNNAQYQLNIVDYYNWDKIDSKFHSLNSVINNCATPMGKRVLKERLCAPYTEPKKIQSCWDLTEKILKIGIWEELREHFKEMADLDKLFRKLSIKYIRPYELYSIYKSLCSATKIIELVSKTTLKTDMYELFSKNQIKQFVLAINCIENKFNIDELKDNNMVDITKSFYLKGVHTDIEELEKSIDCGTEVYDKLVCELEKLCPSDDIKLSVKNNSRDGYHIGTTKIRGEKLQKELEKQDTIIKIGNIEINCNNLLFLYQKSTCKIMYKDLNSHSDEIKLLYEKLNQMIKNYFIADISEWYNSNWTMLRNLVNMIVQFDLISNNAYTSSKYHYVKPILKTNQDKTKTNSFIYAQNLRHPIIERIIDYEYVPHNVKLDDENKGCLIYGYNGAGKSSIMKAIGINLIMAQCGMYVSADTFEFGIFDSLYTRISGGDNLFKGHSSFMIEMNELKTILKKSTSKSLIIGDEICKGTEYLSANAIVASAIIKLVNVGAKFLFATHLHELADVDEIKALNGNGIKFYHLSVEKKNGELVFNRELLDGTGEQVYGITVAQYILDDPEFINKSISIKNNMLEKAGTNTKLVSDKKSIYNKETYVDECAICKSTNKLETHHINWQKDFINTKEGHIKITKKHIVKDSKANLIVLCSDCHDRLHNKEFTINGLVKTSNGVKAI